MSLLSSGRRVTVKLLGSRPNIIPAPRRLQQPIDSRRDGVRTAHLCRATAQTKPIRIRNTSSVRGRVRWPVLTPRWSGSMDLPGRRFRTRLGAAEQSRQYVPARDKPCALKRLARTEVCRAATRARDAPLLVTDPLQLLNQIMAQPASAVRLCDLHENVAVGAVIME